LNLSREQLLEALHEYYRCLRKVADGRVYLDKKEFVSASIEFYRTHIYGLPNVDIARLIVWMLSTDEYKLPDDMVTNCGHARVNSLFRVNLQPAKATRALVLRAVFGETPDLYIDDMPSFGCKVVDLNRSTHDSTHPVPTMFTDAQSALRDAAPGRGRFRFVWGEDDEYSGVTLAEAKAMAHEVRVQEGMEAPGMRGMPAPDAGHINSDLPATSYEPASLAQAEKDTLDDRGGDGLQSFYEGRGFRSQAHAGARYSAAAHGQRISDERQAATDRPADLNTVPAYFLDPEPMELSELDIQDDMVINMQAQDAQATAASQAPVDDNVEVWVSEVDTDTDEYGEKLEQ